MRLFPTGTKIIIYQMTLMSRRNECKSSSCSLAAL